LANNLCPNLGRRCRGYQKEKGKGEKQLKAPKREKFLSLCNKPLLKSPEPQGLIKRKVSLLELAKALKGSNVQNPLTSIIFRSFRR